jgi:hypothetical protein
MRTHIICFAPCLKNKILGSTRYLKGPELVGIKIILIYRLGIALILEDRVPDLIPVQD